MKYVFTMGNMGQFYGSVPEYPNAIKPANQVLKTDGST
jgi:hypothetical protein